jgi:hypothetical protein
MDADAAGQDDDGFVAEDSTDNRVDPEVVCNGADAVGKA